MFVFRLQIYSVGKPILLNNKCVQWRTLCYILLSSSQQLGDARLRWYILDRMIFFQTIRTSQSTTGLCSLLRCSIVALIWRQRSFTLEVIGITDPLNMIMGRIDISTMQIILELPKMITCHLKGITANANLSDQFLFIYRFPIHITDRCCFKAFVFWISRNLRIISILIICIWKIIILINDK